MCYFMVMQMKSDIVVVQGRNIVIFYGSQTGTAEDFSGRLAKESNRFGMKAIVADPEECEMVMNVAFGYLR